MGNTTIEWTDKSWNPITGCTKISPGCKNCYAERFAERFRGVKGHPYEQGFDLKLWPGRLDLPMRWKKPCMVFVNSMSDLFHEAVPDEFIDQVIATIYMSPRHTFQLLTKRAERMFEYFRYQPLRRKRWEALIFERFGPYSPPPVLRNLWLGVSCEDQYRAAQRIPLLLQTPAAVHFISCEPLLGPIDLKFPKGLNPNPNDTWVIVGGESGSRARPMHPDWVRSIRDQCKAAAVPFFFKQWGAYKPLGDLYDAEGNDLITQHGGDAILLDRNGGRWENENAQPPSGTFGMLRCGKKKGGRLLDGKEWNQYPC